MIHCHTPIAGFITRLAAAREKKNGTKVIYTTHGLSFTHLSSKKEWLKYYPIEKIASFFTDIIITINCEDFATAKRFNCKDVRRINGVGIDTKVYHNVCIEKEAYRKKVGIPTNKIMVLSVGELSERKNHQVIIKALGLLDNTDQYVYVICGREVANSGFADRLKKMALENGVDLILLGHRADIPEIMHCSDIGAIPSIREGLGLAGIESLCANVPLVGTDVQGIRDYIIPGKTGYLCEPHDAGGFADALKRLSNPEINKMLSKNCYVVAKKFDITVSDKQMRKIYIDVTGENPK